MTRKYLILIFSAMLLVFTSCVSKKKYLEMETGRLKAEELSRQLNKENSDKAVRIEALIADFESMKNELLQSNAIKDQYIDSLNGEIFIFSEKLNKEKKSLQATNFNLDFEQERLNNALNSKDRTILSLQKKIELLDEEVSNKNSVIDQKNFDLGRMEDQANILESKIKTSENNLIKLQAELEKVKVETGKLQVQIKDKDATILKLENNVKLLKSQIGN